MTNVTHTSFAISLGLAPIVLMPDLITMKELSFYLMGISFGAIFPDIDEPQSYIGRRIPILPRIIKSIFGHRGLTHQFLFFLIPIIFIFAFQKDIKNISNELFIFLIGTSLGILFHQIGDMLSGSKFFKGGIKDYFYPFASSGKYFTPFPKIIRCAVGDRKEQIYNFIFVLIIAYEFKQILNFSISF